MPDVMDGCDCGRAGADDDMHQLFLLLLLFFFTKEMAEEDRNQREGKNERHL